MKIEGLPVIDVEESEEITVAVRADDLLEGDTANPERHPIAIALRRQNDVDDARVTQDDTLVRRGKQWFRYDAPDKRLFKQLQKTLTSG
jgi:hypothetical protein